MSGDRPDANLDAIRHLRCDLIGDRDANQWECRLIDGDGRILATLTGTAVFDLRFIDDHDPDAVTFTFTAPVLPPWPLPRRDEEPDADLLSVPDALAVFREAQRRNLARDPAAFNDAYPEWQRPQPKHDPAAVPDLTLLGPIDLSAVSDPDAGHDRERPFTHTHEHTHVARRILTHTHPHTHGRRERVAGEHRGGDHHGNPRAPDPTGGAQPDDPAEP